MLWSEEPIADELVTEEPAIEYADEADRNAHEGSSIRAPSPFTSDTAEDNAVHPLLLHAKLYTFAHAYLIEPLKTSTKQKIVDQLEKLDSLSEGHERAAVFDVLAYTLSRLPEEDPLIHWLARYASWRLDELRQMATRFDDLLSGEDSTFLKLLLRYVSRSSVNPFSLENEQAMPSYPISTPAVSYVPWRGY